MTSKKDIATFDPNASVPAHIQTVSSSLGNENVSSNDLATPELKLMQALSPELKKTNPKFVDGATTGDIINSVTGEIYEEVYLVTVSYTREFVVFKDRTVGGGFVGAFTSSADAEKHVADVGLNPNEVNIVESLKHACIQLSDKGEIISPIQLVMTGSKVQVSNNWNSQIMQKGGPRFAGIWKLGVVEDSNSKGSWFNYTVDFAGWTSEAVFKEAQALYDSITPLREAA